MLQKYRLFLRTAIESKVSKSQDMIGAAICYVLGEDIKNDEATLKSTNKKEFLSNLKILLKETFEEFPEDENIRQIIGLSSYSIIIIGDEAQGTSKYDEIKQQFKGLEGQIDTQFINISTEYSKQWIRVTLMDGTNSKNSNIIGLYLLVTNSFLGLSFKVAGDVKRLSEYIIQWSRVNEQIPIAYVDLSTRKNACQKQLGELGEPIEVQENSKGTGVINVFAKAIDRYKRVDLKLKETESAVSNLEKQLDESKETIESQNQQISNFEKSANEYKQIDSKLKETVEKVSDLTEKCDESKKVIEAKNKQISSLISDKQYRNILLFIAFLLFGALAYPTHKYYSLTKDDETPFRIISYSRKHIEPFYVKLSPNREYLFISNKAREPEGGQEFFRIKVEDIKSHSKLNLDLEYETMSYNLHAPSNAFGFLSPDTLIISTNYKNTIKILKLDTNLSNLDQIGKDYRFSQTDASLDEIAVWSNKLFVVTTWQNNNILVFRRTNSNPEFNIDTFVVKDEDEKDLLSPSGVSFLTENLIVACFNSEKEEKKTLLIIDIEKEKTVKSLLPIKELNDVDVIKRKQGEGWYALTCSEWASKVYQVDISSESDILDTAKTLVLEPLSIGDGSPTHISYSPDGKYAIVARQNHKRFDLIYTEKMNSLDIERSYNFQRSVSDLYKCEGLEVDWYKGIVFIPNLNSGGKVYCFELEEKYRYSE